MNRSGAIDDPAGPMVVADSSRLDQLPHEKIAQIFRALEAKYERFSEALHDARLIVDRHGKLMDVNPAGVRMFGFESKEEMLQIESLEQFFCVQDDKLCLVERIEQDGCVQDHLLELQRKDHSQFVASVTAFLLSEENGSISYEWILRDVSESRKWQRALVEAEKENRELRESDEKNRNVNRDIVQLIMLMSHDIRGPLVAIAATLKLLIRGTYGKMDESVLNTLTDLLSRVARLLGVAEDYLGKAESVSCDPLHVHSEALDLRQDIIDPVLDEISKEIEQHGIRIDNRLGAIPAGTIHVSMNKIWLKAVYRNLFKNAIKYGGPGCTIAFGFEDHGSYYRLNVYNSGIPISEEHKEKLFAQFGRICSTQKVQSDGIGLGLYLIRQLIRKYGGDIWYETKLDGSDFVFTLAREESCSSV